MVLGISIVRVADNPLRGGKTLLRIATGTASPRLSVGRSNATCAPSLDARRSLTYRAVSQRQDTPLVNWTLETETNGDACGKSFHDSSSKRD